MIVLSVLLTVKTLTYLTIELFPIWTSLTSRSSGSKVPAKVWLSWSVMLVFSTGDTMLGINSIIVAGAVEIVKVKLLSVWLFIITVPVTEKID